MTTAYTTQNRKEGQNAVEDSPEKVIETIEEDLQEALAKLRNAETQIEMCENRLDIMEERI